MNVKYSILDRKYKHLSIKERGQIQVYLELGVSGLEIARKLSRAKSSEAYIAISQWASIVYMFSESWIIHFIG